MNDTDPRILGLKLRALELTTRSENSLLFEGIKTLGELCAKTEKLLLGIPHFGKISLKEVKEKLAIWDLGLDGIHMSSARPWERRIVQIAAALRNKVKLGDAADREVEVVEFLPSVFALCDDGTLWELDSLEGVGASWHRYPDIPQTDRAEPRRPC